MFGLIKPAHVQMRATLVRSDCIVFDQVLASFANAIPTHWSKGARDRAYAIVMGEWVLGKHEAGSLALSSDNRAKVEHLLTLAERFNDRDHAGDGSMSTIMARDIVRALREAGIIPS